MSTSKRRQFCFSATAGMEREYEELAEGHPHHARGLLHRLIWLDGLAVRKRRMKREAQDIDAEIARIFGEDDAADTSTKG